MAQKTLTELVHALPAEIYNTIHDLVFTAPTRQTIQINRHYALPIQFHVSSGTRARFAHVYYGDNSFGFDDRYSISPWLKLLEHAHRSRVRAIKVVLTESKVRVPEPLLASHTRTRSASAKAEIEADLQRNGLDVAMMDVIEIEMRFPTASPVALETLCPSLLED